MRAQKFRRGIKLKAHVAFAYFRRSERGGKPGDIAVAFCNPGAKGLVEVVDHPRIAQPRKPLAHIKAPPHRGCPAIWSPVWEGKNNRQHSEEDKTYTLWPPSKASRRCTPRYSGRVYQTPRGVGAPGLMARRKRYITPPKCFP